MGSTFVALTAGTRHARAARPTINTAAFVWRTRTYMVLVKAHLGRKSNAIPAATFVLGNFDVSDTSRRRAAFNSKSSRIGFPHSSLRRGLLQRVHALRSTTSPPGERCCTHDSSRNFRRPHGGVDVELVGTGGWQIRVRVDGSCCRRNGQGRN